MTKRLIYAATVAIMVSGAGAGHAQAGSAYPFCAVAGGYNSYESCIYPSFAACRAAVSGVGGNCQPNPRFDGYVRDNYDDAPPRRPSRRHRAN
jgi:hypothetical protein